MVADWAGAYGLGVDVGLSVGVGCEYECGCGYVWMGMGVGECVCGLASTRVFRSVPADSDGLKHGFGNTWTHPVRRALVHV